MRLPRGDGDWCSPGYRPDTPRHQGASSRRAALREADHVQPWARRSARLVTCEGGIDWETVVIGDHADDRRLRGARRAAAAQPGGDRLVQPVRATAEPGHRVVAPGRRRAHAPPRPRAQPRRHRAGLCGARALPRSSGSPHCAAPRWNPPTGSRRGPPRGRPDRGCRPAVRDRRGLPPAAGRPALRRPPARAGRHRGPDRLEPAPLQRQRAGLQHPGRDVPVVAHSEADAPRALRVLRGRRGRARRARAPSSHDRLRRGLAVRTRWPSPPTSRRPSATRRRARAPTSRS